MKLHLFAHNDRNLVSEGDKVKQYETKVGTIGTAGGAYYAHLHFSISDGLTPAEIKSYVNNWTKDKVKESYADPRGIDFSKMFTETVDVGNMGYNWLQWFGKGYHPGVDVNGLGGGNTDKGYEFKSACDGEVILAENWGSGWGNIVIIEEKTMEDNCFGYEEKHIKNFEKVCRKVEEVTGYEYGDRINNREAEEMCDELDKLKEASIINCEEVEQELKDCQDENKDLKKRLKEIEKLAH